MRVVFLVDGFNLYHSILKLEEDMGHRTRWLNLDSILKSLLPNIDKSAKCESIYFFTALRMHLTSINPGTLKRHNNFIKILESFGIKVEKGRFKEKQVSCHNCKKSFTKHEEKETDVAIATKLIDIAINNGADAIAIVSGDTDMIPAIKFVKKQLPKIKIFSIFPYKRKNEDLKTYVDGSIKLKPDRYLKHQLPNPFVIGGTSYAKPGHW